MTRQKKRYQAIFTETVTRTVIREVDASSEEEARELASDPEYDGAEYVKPCSDSVVDMSLYGMKEV